MSERSILPEETQTEEYLYTPDAITQRYKDLIWYRKIRHARRSKLARRAMAAGTTLGILAAPPAAFAEMIYRDIQQGKAELAYDQAEVHTIYDYDGDDELYATHGTFVLTGFGTKDPSETAVALDAHQEVGSVFAIEYSNNSLDIRNLAQKVMKTAREHGVSNLTIDGYSLGGLIGTHIAAYIHEHAEDLYITNVVMNSSPIERDDLTARSQAALGPIEWITDLYPDLLYSKKLRKPVELINRNDRYIEESPDKQNNYRISGLNSIVLDGTRYTLNFDRLMDQSSDVDRVMADEKKASAWLMGMQIDVLERNIEDALQALSVAKDDKDDMLPNIIYTGSENPAWDPVVDPLSSSQRLAEIMDEFSNDFHILLGNVQHANPAEARAAYAQIQRGTLRQVTRRNLEVHENAILAHAPRDAVENIDDKKVDRASGPN